MTLSAEPPLRRRDLHRRRRRRLSPPLLVALGTGVGGLCLVVFLALRSSDQVVTTLDTDMASPSATDTVLSTAAGTASGTSPGSPSPSPSSGASRGPAVTRASGTAAATGKSPSTAGKGTVAGPGTVTSPGGGNAGPALEDIKVTTAHYVDCSSGDDDNSGASADSAWRTLAKVSSTTLQAGHAVYFRRGCTFDGGVEIDGTGRADSPVLVTAYGTGSAPVLRNSKGPSWGAVVEVLGSHVVVDGLTLRDAPAAGVRLEEGTTGSVIRNLSISATGFGVYTNGSHHLITRNRVSALHMAVNTPGGDDDNGAVGFPVNGTDVEVSYNECNGCRAPSHDYGTDGGFTEVYNSGDRLFVHHNRAVDCAGFIEFGADSGPRQANGVRIGYNVIENVGYVVTVNSDNAFGIRVDNVRFENNTVVQTEKVNTMFVFPKATASSMNWRNNVFYVGDGSSVWWDEAPFLRSNNVYFTTAGSRLGLSPGSGDIVADPQFVDRARHDYRLRASSPAVNAGQRIDGYARDFLGRVLSGAPDIGAYER